jgi:hypothetical protein
LNSVINESNVDVLGYMVVRADLTYSQGINRMWSRKTRFDFYWPKPERLPWGEVELVLEV